MAYEAADFVAYREHQMSRSGRFNRNHKRMTEADHYLSLDCYYKLIQSKLAEETGVTYDIHSNEVLSAAWPWNDGKKLWNLVMRFIWFWSFDQEYYRYFNNDYSLYDISLKMDGPPHREHTDIEMDQLFEKVRGEVPSLFELNLISRAIRHAVRYRVVHLRYKGPEDLELAHRFARLLAINRLSFPARQLEMPGVPIQFSPQAFLQLIDLDMAYSPGASISEQHQLAWCLTQQAKLSPKEICRLNWRHIRFLWDGEHKSLQVCITVVWEQTDVLYFIDGPPMAKMVLSIPHRVLNIAIRQGKIEGVKDLKDFLSKRPDPIQIKVSAKDDPMLCAPAMFECHTGTDRMQANQLIDYLRRRGKRLRYMTDLEFDALADYSVAVEAYGSGKEKAFRVTLGSGPPKGKLEHEQWAHRSDSLLYSLTDNAVADNPFLGQFDADVTCPRCISDQTMKMMAPNLMPGLNEGDQVTIPEALMAKHQGGYTWLRKHLLNFHAPFGE